MRTKLSKYRGVSQNTYPTSSGPKKCWVAVLRKGQSYYKIPCSSEIEAAIGYNALLEIVGITDTQKKNTVAGYSESDMGYQKIIEDVKRRYNMSESESKSRTFQGRSMHHNKKSSLYVGVSFNRHSSYWHAYITRSRKRYSLGYYACEHHAAYAYNVAVPHLYGDTAVLNNIQVELPKDELNAIHDKVMDKLAAYKISVA